MYYFSIAVLFLSVEWNPKMDVELQSLTVTFRRGFGEGCGINTLLFHFFGMHSRL